PHEAILLFHFRDVAAFLLDQLQEPVTFFHVTGIVRSIVIKSAVVDGVVHSANFKARLAEMVNALASVACHPLADRATERTTVVESIMSHFSLLICLSWI